MLGATLLTACVKERGEAREGDVEEPTVPTVTEGEVQRVGSTPLSGKAVDRLADSLGLIYPQFTRPQLRRMALEQYLIPWAVLADARAVERQAAREECEATARRLKENPGAAGGVSRGVAGDLLEIGFPLWLSALELEPGQWSGPIDIEGRIVLARVLEVLPGEDYGQQRIDLELRVFSYLPEPYGPTEREEFTSRSTLQISDPSWAAYVPQSLQYRMRGPR